MLPKFSLHLLGTNGWYTTATGNTSCCLLTAPACYIILDAGNGIHAIDRYIKDEQKPIFLFLSHFHIDHVSGLHVLDKFNFPQGMTIVTFDGGKEFLNAIMRQPFTISVDDLKMEVDLREVKEGVNAGFPFGLECAELVHSAKCFGYRFDLGGKIVTYCTDTGLCPAAIHLGREADLLITECAYRSGQESKSWPHLNPEQAAQLARDAGAKKLLLIHFDAERYQTFAARDQAQARAKEIFANTVAGRDGMTIEI